MDPATLAIIGQVAQVITQVGIPAVRQILDTFDKEGDPTMEEIEALGNSMVKPADFFKKD
jgi:hypothetical protein